MSTVSSKTKSKEKEWGKKKKNGISKDCGTTRKEVAYV